MNKEIFKPREETLKALLEKKRYFKIPDFQRSYTWDIDKSTDLIESISTTSDNKNLFIGTIYFEEIEGKYYVIDGQQRLVTIFLAINAIRINKKDESLSDSIINSDKESYLDVYESTPIHDRLFQINNIEESDTIEKEVDKKNLTQLQIIENQKLIYTYFKDNPDIIENFMKGLNNTIIILIEVPRAQNINKIFKNINSKGVPLTNADIVKNSFFEYIDNEMGVPIHKQFKYTKWKEIENHLLSDDRTLRNTLKEAKKTLESNIETCIYWYIVFKQKVTQLPKSGFKTSEQYEKLLEENPSNAKQILTELKNFSKSSKYIFYPSQHNPSKKILRYLHPYITFMENIDIKQHIPIFLAIYYKISIENKFQQKDVEILDFADTMYMFHFLFNTIASDRGSKIGARYKNIATSIYNDNLDFRLALEFYPENVPDKETLKNLINKRLFYTKDKPKRDGVIEAEIKEYKFFKHSDQIKDFLNVIEHKLTPNNLQNRVSGINIETVEHIYDASMSYQDFDNFKLMSFLPLEKELNNECEGKSFIEKIKVYRKSKYYLTKKFVEIYEENNTENEKEVREKWLNYLVDFIYKEYKFKV